MSCDPWPMIGYNAPAELDRDVLQAAQEAAQAFLNGATGNRFGTCTYTQRFQIQKTATGVCAATTVTSIGACCAIKLPHAPIQGITSVEVDGSTVDPSTYNLLGGARLAKASGCWPASENCEPGRIVVTYTAGIPLVVGTSHYGMAAGAMAEVTAEYVRALNGENCKLPSRFVSVARQGVSTQALDPALFMELGLTGMPLTDNFIRTVNPNGLRRRPRVVAIDGARRN